jgi:altronate dehydratase small subunit
MKKAILMNDRDNVATVLESVKKGEMINVISTENKVIKNVEAAKEIGTGHKVAVDSINKGQTIVKYGEIIGTAKERISRGEHVHIHNVKSNLKYSVN